ncbi:hypothetical protein L686_03240 [Stutzerimonas stutzeri MF28]|nr:hypothetical protein L686_03240 [Stutzerimonas stutzeri MF28]
MSLVRQVHLSDTVKVAAGRDRFVAAGLGCYAVLLDRRVASIVTGERLAVAFRQPI